MALAIAFALTATALSTSRKAGDLSNMKQSMLAVIMYAGDYDDHFPLAHNWVDACTKYAHKEEVFHCEPFKDTPKYGHALHRTLPGRSFLDISHPELRFAIFDSTDLRKNAVSDMTQLIPVGRYRPD